MQQGEVSLNFVNHFSLTFSTISASIVAPLRK